MKNDKWLKLIEDIEKYLAIICICIVEVVALLKGVNGTMLILAMTAMAGLGGFVMGKKINHKTKDQKCD